jgi:16S rRNA processing protein RimM
MEELLQVGILSSTHGVRGEMKVFPTTDDVSRFKKNKEYILETPKGNLDVKVSGVKFFKQFVILKFEGFDTLDDILPYKGCRLLVNREHAVKCEKDEYFIADLIGMSVEDDKGSHIGTMTDVLQTGANDVYVVEDDKGKEYLFPAIKECIVQVDMQQQKIIIHVMPGLMEE